VNLIVYCKHCRKEFPDYRKVGQHVKDQLFSGLAQQAGTVPIETFLGTRISSPEGGVAVAVGSYEVVMEFSQVAKAYYGSRRDACNAAQIPCHACGKFSHWTRGTKNGR